MSGYQCYDEVVAAHLLDLFDSFDPFVSNTNV